MTIKLTNRQLQPASNALEVLASKRFEDTLLRIRIAKVRRALTEQRELVAPIEMQLAQDHGQRDEKNQLVMGDKGWVIDPDRRAAWHEKHEALLNDSLEVPHCFSLAEVNSATERLESGKIVPYLPEPWIYDALGPLLELPEGEES